MPKGERLGTGQREGRWSDDLLLSLAAGALATVEGPRYARGSDTAQAVIEEAMAESAGALLTAGAQERDRLLERAAERVWRGAVHGGLRSSLPVIEHAVVSRIYEARETEKAAGVHGTVWPDARINEMKRELRPAVARFVRPLDRHLLPGAELSAGFAKLIANEAFEWLASLDVYNHLRVMARARFGANSTGQQVALHVIEKIKRGDAVKEGWPVDLRSLPFPHGAEQWFGTLASRIEGSQHRAPLLWTWLEMRRIEAPAPSPGRPYAPLEAQGGLGGLLSRTLEAQAREFLEVLEAKLSDYIAEHLRVQHRANGAPRTGPDPHWYDAVEEYERRLADEGLRRLITRDLVFEQDAEFWDDDPARCGRRLWRAIWLDMKRFMDRGGPRPPDPTWRRRAQSPQSADTPQVIHPRRPTWGDPAAIPDDTDVEREALGIGSHEEFAQDLLELCARILADELPTSSAVLVRLFGDCPQGKARVCTVVCAHALLMRDALRDALTDAQSGIWKPLHDLLAEWIERWPRPGRSGYELWCELQPARSRLEEPPADRTPDGKAWQRLVEGQGDTPLLRDGSVKLLERALPKTLKLIKLLKSRPFTSIADLEEVLSDDRAQD